MAQILPPVAAVMPAPIVLNLYRDFYADNLYDTANGNYGSVYAPFAIPLAGDGAAVTPLALANDVYASAVHDPQSFLLLCSHNMTDLAAPGAVTLFHRLQRYQPQLGNPAPMYDNNGYAFHGDLVHGQIQSVRWPDQAFYQVNALIRVPNAATIAQAFAENPDTEMLGPYAEADQGTELARVRQCMLVPFRYVRLLLETPLTPRQAWERLAGAIFTDGNEVACLPLLQWLQVALTRQNANERSRLTQEYPTVPLASPAFVKRRYERVLTDIPSLGNTAVHAGANQIAAGIGLLVDESRADRLAADTRREADKTKTVDAAFGPTATGQLLRMMHCVTTLDLPKLWHELASAPKKQERGITQNALDRAAAELGLAGLQVLVTPELANKIKNLSFKMSDANNLTTGIHPFTVGYQSQAETAKAQEKIDTYEMVQQGQGAPTLGEAATIVAAAHKVPLPNGFTEASITFNKYRVLLRACLGRDHPQTLSFEAFKSDWDVVMPELLEFRPRITGHHPACLMVRWIQLRASEWHNAQWNNPAKVPASNFSALLSEIRLQTNWEPTMPIAYMSTTPTTYSPPAATTTTTVQRPPAPALAHQPAPARQPRARDQELMVSNTAFNSRFTQFSRLPYRLRDLVRKAVAAGNDLPNNGSGTQMCLSYHIKGKCNTGCGRIGDHRQHTTEEDDSLNTWCTQNYTAA